MLIFLILPQRPHPGLPAIGYTLDLAPPTSCLVGGSDNGFS